MNPVVAMEVERLFWVHIEGNLLMYPLKKLSCPSSSKSLVVGRLVSRSVGPSDNFGKKGPVHYHVVTKTFNKPTYLVTVVLVVTVGTVMAVVTLMTLVTLVIKKDAICFVIDKSIVTKKTFFYFY